MGWNFLKLIVESMNNINILQNVVVNRDRIAELVKESSGSEIKQLLGIKDSQLSNLRRGDRSPSTDGLLRLMMMYNLTPEDLATVSSK